LCFFVFLLSAFRKATNDDPHGGAHSHRSFFEDVDEIVFQGWNADFSGSFSEFHVNIKQKISGYTTRANLLRVKFSLKYMYAKHLPHQAGLKRTA